MLHKYFKMISLLLKAQISVTVFTTNVKTIDIGEFCKFARNLA